uniref:MC027L n=1 Tax=Rousettus bat poxvirus TaxID=3141933 RepID=A0AAU7E1X8_9POXV
MRQMSTLIGKVLMGVSDTQDEQMLHDLARSLALTPTAAAMCLAEAVGVQHWIYSEDHFSTPENDRVLLACLASTLRPAIHTLQVVFRTYNAIARRDLIHETISSFTSNRYLPLVMSAAKYVTAMCDIHIALPRAHSDLRVLFRSDLVSLFELEVLRDADRIAGNIIAAPWSVACRSLMHILRMGPCPEIQQWPSIQGRILRDYLAKNASFFVTHAHDLFDEGLDIIEGIRDVATHKVFARALVAYLKILKTRCRVRELLCTYARFAEVLHSASGTEPLRSVLTPVFLNRHLERELHGPVLEETLSAIVCALLVMPREAAVGCVRVMRARAVRRMLSLEADMRVELQVSARLAEIDPRGHQSLLDLICSMAFPVRQRVVDAMLVCRHTAPEKLPDGYLPQRFFDVVPDFAVAIALMHAANVDKTFHVCVSFGFAEFAVTLANGLRIDVTGNTAHYLLAARIGTAPPPRRSDLCALLDDKETLLTATLSSMESAGLVEVDAATGEVRFVTQHELSRIALYMPLPPKKKKLTQ